MTIEQSDLLLQSLSADKLRELAANVPFKTGGFKGKVEDMAILEADLRIQNRGLSELKQRVSLEEKMKHTGLPVERVQQIERDKNQATLAELIQYCRGLNIAFKDFIPELF